MRAAAAERAKAAAADAPGPQQTLCEGDIADAALAGGDSTARSAARTTDRGRTTVAVALGSGDSGDGTEASARSAAYVVDGVAMSAEERSAALARARGDVVVRALLAAAWCSQVSASGFTVRHFVAACMLSSRTCCAHHAHSSKK